jgi:hypothetical protein
MGRYLVLWEIDKTHIPADPKERAAGWAVLMEMVKKDIEKGIIKEWGAFVGQHRGFDVVEGTEVEVANMIQQYVPYIDVKLHSIASVSQVDEVIKALSG